MDISSQPRVKQTLSMGYKDTKASSGFKKLSL